MRGLRLILGCRSCVCVSGIRGETLLSLSPPPRAAQIPIFLGARANAGGTSATRPGRSFEDIALSLLLPLHRPIYISPWDSRSLYLYLILAYTYVQLTQPHINAFLSRRHIYIQTHFHSYCTCVCAPPFNHLARYQSVYTYKHLTFGTLYSHLFQIIYV